jgi:perosamine synthetase
MSNLVVPVNEPFIGDEEKKLVNECLETGWISSAGRFINEFEKNFSNYCECEYGVSTTNGTSAIHLALKSIGILPEDEVLIPSFTMAGSVYPIVQCGAVPIFVDSEMETYNLSFEDLLRKITSKTKAIVVVHIYGHPVDMDPIMDLAKERGLWVVEDAAEAHGALYKGRKAGGIGHIGCFSFYANKIITTGEGGMLVSNDYEIIQEARKLKDLAHGEKRFTHILPEAYNYRMTNIQAALGLGQLNRVEETISIKIANAALYNALLEDISDLVTPVCQPWARNVYWMYGVLVKESSRFPKDYLMSKLESMGIGTRSFFFPQDKQPAFSKYGKGDCPNAEKLGATGFYLPSGQTLTEQQIAYVSESLHKVMR